MDPENECEVTVEAVGNKVPIKVMQSNSKSRLIVSGDEQGQLLVWKEDRVSAILPTQHTQEILCLEFVEDYVVLSSSLDSRVIMWDLEGNTAVTEVRYIDYVL